MSKNQQIAWCLDGDSRVSIAYGNYQGPCLTADEDFVDLSVSATGVAFVLEVKQEVCIVHYTQGVFPPQWKEFQIGINAGEYVRKIDAAPDNTLYFVDSGGKVGRVKVDVENPEDVLQAEYIDGIESATQVSVGADGTVWVVSSEPEVGTIACYLDGSEWKKVPEAKNPLKITGTKSGGFFMIQNDGTMAHYDKDKGTVDKVETSFNPSEISEGPDGRLWSISRDMTDDFSKKVYWTDNAGQDWAAVDGSNAVQLDGGVLPA